MSVEAKWLMSRKKWFLGRLTSALIVSALLVSGTVLTIDMAANSSGNIQAFCVNKQTEKVSFRKTCKDNEKRYSYAKIGKSAYQTWLDLGNTGSERDFIESLRGSSGSSVQSFATTCYQKLMDAESSGYVWTSVRDRNNFERLTGCKVSEIDVNPNAHLGTDSTLKVSPIEYFGYLDAFGDGGYFSSYGGSKVLYEVSVDNQTGLKLCGPAGQDRDFFIEGSSVFVNESTGKTFILGNRKRSSLIDVYKLPYGLGPEVTEVIYERKEFEWGPYIFVFSKWPIAIPLGQTATLELERVINTFDSENVDVVDFSDFPEMSFNIRSQKFVFEDFKSGKELPLLSLTLPWSTPVIATEAVGSGLIEILVGNDTWVSDYVSVGVEYCEDDSSPVASEIGFVSSTSVIINEARPETEDFMVSSDLLRNSGWTNYATHLERRFDDEE